MKVDPVAQQRLLALQALDTALDNNRHREATLPERARASELKAASEDAHNRAVRARTELTDLTRTLSRSEDEVAAVRARAERDKALMASGQVTSSKQLADLEHEVKSLARRQAELEDAELQVMEDVEAAEAALKHAVEHADEIAAQLAEAEQARDAALAELQQTRVALVEDRKVAATGIPNELMAMYDRIRSHGNSVAVGLLRYGRCESCQMELSRADLDAARAAAADEVLRCPECQAIMVRSGESGL